MKKQIHRKKGGVLLWLALSACCAATSAAAQFLDAPNTKDTATLSFEAAYEKARAANPDNLKFTLDFGDKTQFHRGEIMTLNLNFSSEPPIGYKLDPRLYDRVGRLNGTDFFIVDRPQDAPDPLGYVFSDGFIGFGGLSAIPQPINDRVQTLPRLLNEYRRFDRPGHYRMYVLSRRLFPTRQQFGTPFGGGLVVASQPIEFEILPGDEWAQNRSREIIALLGAPADKTSQRGYQEEEKEKALLHELRFLDTPLSRRWLIAHFTDERFPYNGDFRFALLGSGDKNDAIAALRTSLAAPASAFTSPLLNVMATLLFEQSDPPALPPYPINAAKDSALVQQYRAIQTVRDTKRAKIERDLVHDLSRALPAKRGAARAISLQALAEHLDADGSPQASEVQRQLLATWADLPRASQTSLLQNQWPLLRNEAMLPILEKAFSAPTQTRAFDVENERSWRTLLLQRLQQLAPATARKYLLSEMQRPGPRVSIGALLDLPEPTLPALDAIWLDNLRHHADYTTDTVRVAQLIARYASPQIEAPLRKLVQQNVWGGDTERALLAYFVRVDPTYGVKLLRAAMARDHFARLGDIAAFVMNPELETLAIQTLDNANRTLAADAAQALAHGGTQRGRQALWQRLEQWHANLAGKILTPEQANFDNALVQAIASLPAVQTQLSTREKLRSLALSREAREPLREVYFDNGKNAPSISYRRPDFGRRMWNLGIRNGEFRSLAELGRKLQQYPRGTTFNFRIEGREAAPDSAAINARVQKWVQTNGYKVVLKSVPSRRILGARM